MKISWSPHAKQRVREYGDYIAQDNVEAAERWTAKILDEVERLKDFPEQGRVVPEHGRANVREIFYKNHRIVYRIESRQPKFDTPLGQNLMIPLFSISYGFCHSPKLHNTGSYAGNMT